MDTFITAREILKSYIIKQNKNILHFYIKLY